QAGRGHRCAAEEEQPCRYVDKLSIFRQHSRNRAEQEMSDGRWQFWIDRGGTFTDIVARTPEGEFVTHKLLSENPERYRDAALQGIRDLLGAPADGPIPVERIAAVKMGTTVGTNALLERKGEPTVLVINCGF